MSEQLKQLFKEKIVILDGAMGTAIQDYNLTAKDFGGEDYEGCNEYLVLTKPDIIQAIHESYLEAGADIIGSDETEFESDDSELEKDLINIIYGTHNINQYQVN